MTTPQDLIVEWRKEADKHIADAHGRATMWDSEGEREHEASAAALLNCANQLEAVLREEEEK